MAKLSGELPNLEAQLRLLQLRWRAFQQKLKV